MNVRQKLLRGTEGLLTAAVVGLVLGTTLAFGGAVWWGRPVIAILTLLVVLAFLYAIVRLTLL